MTTSTFTGAMATIVAIALLASCTPDETPSQNQQQPKARTLTLAFEAPGAKPGPTSRASLAPDALTPRWDAGDAIKLSNAWDREETVTLKAEDITENADGTNTATITTTIQGTLYAIYPADAVTSIKGEEVTLKLPTETDGSFSQAHIAVARSAGDALFFRNSVSILEFTTPDLAVASIDLTSEGLPTTFTVRCGDDLTVVSHSKKVSNFTATLQPGAQAVFIPVAPGAQIPADALFTFRDSNHAVIRRLTHTTPLTPGIGGIYGLGAASLPQAPSGAAGGLFSVSPSRQVFIASANLTSSSTFASSQLDYGGLFSSEEAATASFPANWRLLTPEELNYLFSARTSADGTAPSINSKSAIYLKCKVKCKVNDLSGLLLFPDTFVWPTGAGAPDISKASRVNAWNDNFFATFTLEEFAALEEAGCVFLPAAGSRTSGETYNVGTQGYYRTTTGIVLSFNADAVAFDGTNNPATGESIRLVTDAN